MMLCSAEVRYLVSFPPISARFGRKMSWRFQSVSIRKYRSHFEDRSGINAAQHGSFTLRSIVTSFYNILANRLNRLHDVYAYRLGCRYFHLSYHPCQNYISPLKTLLYSTHLYHPTCPQISGPPQRIWPSQCPTDTLDYIDPYSNLSNGLLLLINDIADLKFVQPMAHHSEPLSIQAREEETLLQKISHV